MMRFRCAVALGTVLALVVMVRADGPADNLPDKVRRVPPPGIPITDTVREELAKRASELSKTIDCLRGSLKGKPALLALLPDVQIFHKAVHDALKYDEFYAAGEPKTAGTLLDLGFERAAQLKEGKPLWTAQTGPVVRGYVSKIDGSVQPYGLVVPDSYRPGTPHQHRLDFWCHGRGEKLTELAFLDQRLRSRGEFTPANAFVLHLYGRYCCANKFAGEVDLFEAYDSVRQHYPIDENRLAIRGFSMGGAACWQFAVHYRRYMRECNIMVQFCLAHLIRDIKFLTTLPGREAKAYGERLRQLVRELFAIIHEREQLSARAYQQRLQAKRSEILTAGTTAVPESRHCQTMA